MFCPRCGSAQNDELKFCKSCGANLYAVRQVVDTRETNKQVSPGKPWYAEMAIYKDESKIRQEELDHRRGIAPEITRYKEIKAGVITGSVGLGFAIFLHVFMKGLILSGNISDGAGEILSRVWLAGLIPFMVGLALIINGVFVSKKLAEVVKRASNIEEKETNPPELRSADTTEFIPASYSVTEDTTKHLKTH